jgi:hypothetical protein
VAVLTTPERLVPLTVIVTPEVSVAFKLAVKVTKEEHPV